MILAPAALVVSSLIGLALGAILALLRVASLRPIAIATIAVFAIGPIALAGRTPLEHTTGRAVWEWSAVGGATVQAAYVIDPLAVIGAAAVSIATGVALVAAARKGAMGAALLAALGIVLIALVTVSDVVVATLLAGSAAVLAVAAGLFVAPQSAAARLAALLAIGVECLIAAALLLARAGVASFDLDEIAPNAISPGVVLVAALGAALFAGLYPFVPWRYERSPSEPRAPLASLRGLALFPVGIAATTLMFRFVTASGRRPVELPLPALSIETQAAVVAGVLMLAALAVRTAPRGAAPRRAVASAVFVAAAVALPLVNVAHLMALLPLLTVVYATVASTALVEEWGVARFHVRLAVLWAAFASGSAATLAAGFFGIIASSVSLVIETVTVSGALGGAIATSARLLSLLGPFLAVAGLAFAADPIAGVLAGIVLAWAALLELGHAIRETAARGPRALGERAFAALVAVAIVFVVSLMSSVPATRAAADLLGPLPSEAADLVLGGLALLATVLGIVLVALPGTIRVGAGERGVAFLRRVLAASDPVPALALAYRALEAWSEGIGSSFAALEDRAGVWLATALIALALIWAATS